MNAFVLLNHELTHSQKTELINAYGVHALVMPPQHVAGLWKDVDPRCERVSHVCAPVIHWLKYASDCGDVAVIQGNVGCCAYVASWCAVHGIRPVYATTRRVAHETAVGDEQRRRESVFEHVRFCAYEFWKGDKS